MYPLLRKALFKFDAETAHDLGVKGLNLIGRYPALRYAITGATPAPTPNLERKLFGLSFPNPLGVAAGLDKQGNAVDGLFSLGFGWVETGTVTPLAQAGNPRPRMFRLHEHEALINRMGFNSIGVERFTANIRRQRAVADRTGILSINIGKNARTTIEDAASDYLTCLNSVYQYADIVTINISSPNTPELRNLQFGDELARLLDALSTRREQLATDTQRRVALLIKIAADDMIETSLKGVVENSLNSGIDGIIAVNTTTARPLVAENSLAQENGGLSGKPLLVAAQSTLNKLAVIADGRLPLVGCGGIHDAESAQRRLTGGAELLQLYTALIYQGPRLVPKILNGLASRT